jgi:hypothetical protein
VKLVIIESPFACDPEKMILYGRKCIHDSVTRDEAPIASHLLFTQPGVLDDNDPVERSMGIAAGHEWLKVADLVAFYTDFGISGGMKLGQERAQRAGIKCEYRQIGQDGLDRYADTVDADEAEAWEQDERDRIVRALHVEATKNEWMGWGSAIRWIADKIERNRL